LGKTQLGIFAVGDVERGAAKLDDRAARISAIREGVKL